MLVHLSLRREYIARVHRSRHSRSRSKHAENKVFRTVESYSRFVALVIRVGPMVITTIAWY